MITLISQNILRFVFLLFFQGLILNELNMGTWFVPYIYILFLLALPFETPNWLIIPLAFLYGLSMDAFSNTPGLHAAACVFTAYGRPRVLRLLAPREGYEFTMQPGIQSMGFTWFIYYAGIMTVLHHTFFFYLEVFHLSEFFYTLMRVICSSIFTVFLIVLAQFVTYRPGQR